VFGIILPILTMRLWEKSVSPEVISTIIASCRVWVYHVPHDGGLTGPHKLIMIEKFIDNTSWSSQP